MLRRIASNFLECLHIIAAVAYTVSIVIVTTTFMWLVRTLLFPFSWLTRVTRYELLVGRYPIAFLCCSVVAVAYLAAQGHLPFGYQPVNIVVGSAGWLFLLQTVCIAYPAATENTRLIDQYAPTIAARWPDRWYARHMKKPVNAIYVRCLITNSIMMIPATLAIVVPGTISAYSVIFFVLAIVFTSSTQESLDHSDMHNHLFDGRHLPRGGTRLVFWLTHQYLRSGLNTLCLRIPHFNHVQHLYIHHVENNGVRDTQTTVLHDRTSCFDFCRYALHLGLSWSFAFDVYAYLRRKRNVRQCRFLLLGLAVWFGALGLLALHNLAAAVFFLTYRFIAGVGIAVSVYFWHALADPEDPENVYTNSVNLIPAQAGGPDIVELHVLHHEQGGAHFTRVLTSVREDLERWAGAGVLSLSVSAAEPVLFTKALLAKRFDVIANLVVIREGATRADLQHLIQHRTRPVKEKLRSERYRRLDRQCAMLLTTYLLPGRLPPLEASSS